MNGRDEVKLPGEPLVTAVPKNARELTAEIEAATNANLGREAISNMLGGVPAEQGQAENLAQAENWAANQATEDRRAIAEDRRTMAQLGMNQTAELGRSAIFSNAETTGGNLEGGDGGMASGSEMAGGNAGLMERRDEAKVEGMAERDNGYGTEYEPGVSTVGEASKLERRERAADDRENLRNEIDPKRDNEAKIMAHSQEERGKAAARWSGELLRRRNFVVSEFISEFRKEQDGMLNDFEVPHPIGSRN